MRNRFIAPFFLALVILFTLAAPATAGEVDKLKFWKARWDMSLKQVQTLEGDKGAIEGVGEHLKAYYVIPSFFDRRWKLTYYFKEEKLNKIEFETVPLDFEPQQRTLGILEAMVESKYGNHKYSEESFPQLFHYVVYVADASVVTIEGTYKYRPGRGDEPQEYIARLTLFEKNHYRWLREQLGRPVKF